MATNVPTYHVGIVVADVERAAAELTELLGLRWAQVLRGQARWETPDGSIEYESCFTYSLEGPPYLELLEQRPGTVLSQLGLHHLGIWTDDWRAESARFSASGCPRETVALTPEGDRFGGCYHTTSDGLRLELVNIPTSGPKLLRYLAGGTYA